jgi:DNA-binding response OmpR family regulator
MAGSSSTSKVTGGGALVPAQSQDDLSDTDTLIVGDFNINLRSRHATLRSQELRLTPEEFELLVFLVRHRTSVITPYTRLSTRWGSSQARQADFLRVLGQLRQKLALVAGSSHYIRTEPWVVCQFDPDNRDEAH